jgi:HPt (histidine-containing phosphotransfer) domain-containing protein
MQTSGNQHFDPTPLQRLNHLTNDPQVIRQGTDAFRADAQNQFTDIERLCSELNYPQLARAAHKLKGACLIVGLVGCAQRCELLEQAALNQSDVKTLFSQLRQQLFPGLEQLGKAVAAYEQKDKPT